MYIDSQYKNAYLPFPKHDINPDDKGEKWCRDFAKAIYGYYLNSRSGITPNDRSRFYELRMYADGRQNPNKYKDWLIGKGQPQEKARKGFMNVNFDDIFSPAPAYIEQIIGRFEEVDHQAHVTATDPKSMTDKERAKNTAWFRKLFKPEIEAITGGAMMGGGEATAMPGQEVGQAPQQFEPESREDLELYASLGGFKQRYEVAMEQAIHHSFDISEWREAKRKILRDLITLGCAATADYVDKSEQKVKTKYIDILDVITEYSHATNFNNSRFAAVSESYTVEELLACTDIPEERLSELAAKHTGVMGNPEMADWRNNTGIIDNGTLKFNSWRLPVLTCYFKTTNNNYYTERKNARGETWTNKERYGKVYDTDKKKTKIDKVRTVYQCKWIIGTDHVFDFGTMTDIPRPTINDVELPIHIYRLTGKSFIERIKNNLDTIHMTKLKLQNAIAIAAPKGVAIEWGSLQGMTMGNSKLKPIDLITMREQSGNIFYKATTNMGTQTGYMNNKPIQELEGGLGAQLNEFINIFETEFNLISKLTGVDRVSLSSQNVNTETSGRALQIAGTNTDNVLKPLYGGYIWLKEANAKNMASRIQTICIFNKNKDKGYNDAIGDAGVEAIKQAGMDRVVRYGIKIVPMPTDEEKAEVKAAAVQALNVGKNGQPLLDYSDYLFVMRMLNAGSLRYAEAYLQMKISKKEKQTQDNMQANMEVQGQQNQQLEQVKQQNAKDLASFQTDEKIRFETAKTDLEIQKEERLAPIKHAQKVAEHDVKLFAQDHIQDKKNEAMLQKEAISQAGQQTAMDFGEAQPPV